MNRVVIQEGYSLPFAGESAGSRRRRHAKRAKRSGYKGFMKKCLKSHSMKQCAKKWRIHK